MPSPTEQKQTATKQKAVPPVQTKTTPPAITPDKKEIQTGKVQTQPAVEKKDADYDAGMEAYEKGKGLDAIRLFKKSGSAKSYYMLGLIYENGCGTVGSNGMMARKNFKKPQRWDTKKQNRNYNIIFLLTFNLNSLLC